MSIKARFLMGPLHGELRALPEMVFEYNVPVLEELPYYSTKEYIQYKIATYKYVETLNDECVFVWKETR